jgi:tRNA isopentenyl-2-thiomethyl-A-37 hydroxylase MiaE
MEAVSSSERSVNTYQTTRRDYPEDSHQFLSKLVCGQYKENLSQHRVAGENRYVVQKLFPLPPELLRSDSRQPIQ